MSHMGKREKTNNAMTPYLKFFLIKVWNIILYFKPHLLNYTNYNTSCNLENDWCLKTFKFIL